MHPYLSYLLYLVLASVPVITEALVPSNNNLDKGFNLLETASKLVPQGAIVNTAKETWKFAWQRMMAELAPQDKTGNYSRPKYTFGGKIGDGEFVDEAGRYHLFLGNPCPWCHRCKLVLNVRQIDPSIVGVTMLVDDPVKASRGGWIFSSSNPDPLYRSFDLRELYENLSPSYKGRCTAPLLVDVKQKKIVSNESADICRMLIKADFTGAVTNTINLCPPELEEEINETNEWTYRLLNNGVYRCGFSTKQSAYDTASQDVRKGLQRCESIFKKQPFLCGNYLTEADLRLLPTILRYDGVYSPLFKAGGTHLRIKCDYPSTFQWLKRCWKVEGVSQSIDLEDACSSYFRQLFPLNAGGIIPTPVTAKELGLLD